MRSNFKQLLLAFAVAFVGCLAGIAQAAEWTPYAKVVSTYVSSGTNMYFRVFGPVSAQCPNHSNWAYINESDSGAKGKIAALLTAYALGKNVRLFIEPKDFYANGTIFCHVVEVQVSD